MLQAKETRLVRPRARSCTRRGQSLKAKTKEPASGDAADGFLDHRFGPLISAENAFAKQQATEKYFFDSLDHLSRLYGLNTVDISCKPYPYNVSCAFQSAVAQMEKLHPDLCVIIVQTEQNPAALCTIRTYNTGTTLYYLPVENICKLLKAKKCRRRANLILSCLAYFHLVGGIPFYTEPGSFVGGQYEMISDWTTNEPGEWQKEDYKSALSDLRDLNRGGNLAFRSISNPVHLRQFERRIKKFRATTSYDKELFDTARKILDLYQRNGVRSIFNSVIPGLINPLDEERIYAEQYISFCWSDKGWIADHLFEMVNSIFQECGTMDEPCSIQLFDTVQEKETHDLTYETEFLHLLCKMIDLLIDLP